MSYEPINVGVCIYADYDILPFAYIELNDKFMEVFKSQETLLGSLSVFAGFAASLRHFQRPSSWTHGGNPILVTGSKSWTILLYMII